jgi:hypothetical protein
VARRHVVLVGLPGSGKTTVGALAARELGAPFTDLDIVIESRERKSVGAIFAEQGEAAFRALEAAVGAELLAGPPLILAPGGGFFADARLRDGSRVRPTAQCSGGANRDWRWNSGSPSCWRSARRRIWKRRAGLGPTRRASKTSRRRSSCLPVPMGVGRLAPAAPGNRITAQGVYIRKGMLRRVIRR